MEMVVHGESIDLNNADGWFACENGEIIGLITYRIAGSRIEILSLDSLREKEGIGTLLLEELIKKAKIESKIPLWTSGDSAENGLRIKRVK